MDRLTLPERLALFDQLRLMQLRHWPAGALWVYLTHPQGRARLYRGGSFDLFRAG
jgi:hypothetical protein